MFGEKQDILPNILSKTQDELVHYDVDSSLEANLKTFRNTEQMNTFCILRCSYLNTLFYIQIHIV